jgi:Glycosyltransferase family 87
MATASELNPAEAHAGAAPAERPWPLKLVGLLPLLAIPLMVLMLVALAASGPSLLAPTAMPHHYPSWMAGPLAGVWPGAVPRPRDLQWLVTATLVAMFIAYLLSAWSAGYINARWVIGVLLAVQVILFLAPPMSFTDVFNYINYARMGVVHHLNPYTTLPIHEPHSDPAYAISNWHYLLTPYAPLFTLLTYALVPLGVAASFWVIKLVVLVSSLALLGLVWWGARMIGRVPAVAIAFVGLNPIVLIWGAGADHYDVVVMVLVVGAMFLLVARHPPLQTRRLRFAAELPPSSNEIVAGVLLIAAVSVKASAAVFLPIGIALAKRNRRVMLTSMAASLLVIVATTLAVFGPHLGGVRAQSTLTSPEGLPNLLGLALGLGGETAWLRGVLGGVTAVFVLGVAARAWRRPAGRMEYVCVSALAFVFTLGWSAPWYVLLPLPFAALAANTRWRAVLALYTIYALLASSPNFPNLERAIHFYPRSTALGREHVDQFADLAAK